MRTTTVFGAVLAACASTVFAEVPAIAPELTLGHGYQLTAGPCNSFYKCRQILDEQCGPGRYQLFGMTVLIGAGKARHSISYACAESGYTVTTTTLATGEVSLRIWPCAGDECDLIAFLNCPNDRDIVEKRVLDEKNQTLTAICSDEPSIKLKDSN